MVFNIALDALFDEITDFEVKVSEVGNDCTAQSTAEDDFSVSVVVELEPVLI